MKKKTQTYWRKKCVERAKKIALERDGFQCQKCGKKKSAGWRIEASHVFPEGAYHSLSADPENIKALCSWCHIRWWHSVPTEAGVWFREKFPDRFASLTRKKLTVVITRWDKVYENYAKT